jgi:hypothetical protein
VLVAIDSGDVLALIVPDHLSLLAQEERVQGDGIRGKSEEDPTQESVMVESVYREASRHQDNEDHKPSPL